MFADVIPTLTSQGHEVYAPDLPGHGSSVAAGPFTFKLSTTLLLHTIEEIRASSSTKVVLVGVSLGGQAVLDVIQHDSEGLVDAALVASAPIGPPDNAAQWELPHMPVDQKWIQIMTEDVNTMGMQNASAIQEESFSFKLVASTSFPPVLVVVGEHDVAMATRDFEQLSQVMKKANGESESMVLKDAWHNHPIDIPKRFAKVILDWTQKALG